MSLMSNVIQSSSYMHIHNFTGGMTPCGRYTVSTGYFVMKCCKITYPPPSLPPSSGHTGLLRLRLSFSLPSSSASRLQASLACLASACSAAVCSQLRSHSFSAFVITHAHLSSLGRPAVLCSSIGVELGSQQSIV